MSVPPSPITSPTGPREESVLEAFFAALGTLSFEKAKELMDRERETYKGSSTTSSWGIMVHCLSHFVALERMYLSLTYVTHKRFKGFSLKNKETYQATYDTIIKDLHCVEDAIPRTRDATTSSPFPSAVTSFDFDSLMAHLCGQLSHFLAARKKMISFYVSISDMGDNENMTYHDLMTVMNDVIQNHAKAFHHPLLSPLRTLFNWELDVLCHLLQAQILLGDWQFLPSLLQLHSAHSKLHSWLTSATVKEAKKTFGGGSKVSAMPALYHWLAKFKGVLVSKFSVYFHHILSKQSTPNEMKSWLTRAPEDYFSRIVMFHKKCDPFNISLVLDTNGLATPYQGPGYHHPGRSPVVPLGMDSFPAVLSYPGEQPKEHWPIVVMLITQRLAQAAVFGPPKSSYFFDQKASSTYYITKIDPRISLVVIYQCKKSEKDSHTNAFLADFSAQLRSQWILGSIRNV